MTTMTVTGEEDLAANDARPGVVNLAILLAEIRETHRFREDMMRAEQRLLLQVKAIQRRIDAAEGDRVLCDLRGGTVSLAALSILPLEAARAAIVRGTNIGNAHIAGKLDMEHRLQKLATQLPVWPWVEGVRGFGSLGLAQIIGECGDLCGYDRPAKVWKRMGLAVIDGERQRRVSGAAAIEHGYVPRRRAIMYNIGESLIKGNQDGLYRTAYLRRKAYELERTPDMALCVAHARARRYMEKLLLKHLWQQWRAATA